MKEYVEYFKIYLSNHFALVNTQEKKGTLEIFKTFSNKIKVYR